MKTTLYNKGVISIHLGEKLNGEIEAECGRLGLSKSKVARFLFKKWLAANARHREAPTSPQSPWQ